MIADLITNTCMLAMLLLVLLAAIAITVRDDTLANLYQENSRLRTAVADLIHQREDALRLVAQKDLSIRGHLRDSVSLLHELERLKREAGESWDTNELRGKAWLGQENVA